MKNKESELLDAIKELYDFEPVGGALHIALDDQNVDDEDLDFCEKYLDNEYRKKVYEDYPLSQEDAKNNYLVLRDLHIAIIKLLRLFPPEERERIINKYHDARWG